MFFAIIELIALVRYGNELHWDTPRAWRYLGFLLMMLMLESYLSISRPLGKQVPA